MQIQDFTICENGILIGTEMEQYPETLIIPAVIDGKTVKHIGTMAFSGVLDKTQDINHIAHLLRYADNTRIKKVIIDEGIESIGPGAFMGCIELESVQLPNSVRYIDDYAFFNCCNLLAIHQADRERQIDQTYQRLYVDKIGKRAFQACNLANSKYYDPVKKRSMSFLHNVIIEENAFTYVYGLQNIDFKNGAILHKDCFHRASISYIFIKHYNKRDIDPLAFDSSWTHFEEDVDYISTAQYSHHAPIH